MANLLQLTDVIGSRNQQAPCSNDNGARHSSFWLDIWDECPEDYEDAQQYMPPVHRLKELVIYEAEHDRFQHQAELFYGERSTWVVWTDSQKTQLQLGDLVEIESLQEPFMDSDGRLEVDGLTKVRRADSINLFYTILPAWNVPPSLQQEAATAWELMEEGHQRLFNMSYLNAHSFIPYLTSPCSAEGEGSEPMGNLRLRLKGTRFAIFLAENTDLANLSANLFAALMNDQACP